MKGRTPYHLGVVLLVGLLASAILSGCEAAKTPTAEIATEPSATEVIEEVVEDPIAILAEQIRHGEVDVGDTFSVAPGQRFHNIHAQTIELACELCHRDDLSSIEVVFFDQDTSAIAPGPVLRTVCLECHEEGPATRFYGLGSK